MTNSCVYINIIFWLACGVQQDLQHIKDTDPRSSIAYCVPKLVCRVVKKKYFGKVFRIRFEYKNNEI